MVRKLYIPAMVPILDSIPTTQEKNLGSTVHSQIQMYDLAKRTFKKKKKGSRRTVSLSIHVQLRK